MDTLWEIVNGIHEVTGINIIRNNSRKSDVVDAKRVYSLLATSRTEETSQSIGDYVGRNRSLISHHKKKGKDYLQTDKIFKILYQKCIERIESLKDPPYIKKRILDLEKETIRYKKILQKKEINVT